MKKNSFFFAWFVCCALFLSVFAQPAFAAGERIILRVNAINNPSTMADVPSVYCIQKLKADMEKRFPGRVEVRIFWDQSLALANEAAINQLQNKVIHLAFFPMGSLAEFTMAGVPFNVLFLVPYPHRQIVYDAFDGEIGKMITERMIRDCRIRPVAFWQVGFRHLLNNKNPITELNSLSALKFRVQPNPVHLDSFRRMGTNPVPVPFAELFTALQQGVVDGTENPLENIVVRRLYEVQKFLTLSGHAFEMGVYAMGEEFYQSLPADIRQGLDEVLADILQLNREGMNKLDEDMLKSLSEKMQVNDLPQEQLARFREAVAPARAIAREQAGAEYTDKFFALMKQYEDAYLARIKK